MILFIDNDMIYNVSCAGLTVTACIAAILVLCIQVIPKGHDWQKQKKLMPMVQLCTNLMFAFAFKWYWAILIIVTLTVLVFIGTNRFTVPQMYQNEQNGICSANIFRKEKQERQFTALTSEEKETYRQQIPPISEMQVKRFPYYPVAILPALAVVGIMEIFVSCVE